MVMAWMSPVKCRLMSSAGDERGLAAAGAAALHAEHGAERRLAQREHRVLAEAAHAHREADRRRRLALAGGRRVDRRDEDEPALRRAAGRSSAARSIFALPRPYGSTSSSARPSSRATSRIGLRFVARCEHRSRPPRAVSRSATRAARASALLVAHQRQRVLGVAVRVAVADEEIDVPADALGAERRRGEARPHREEVDHAAIARGQDGAHLDAGDVDAREREVGLAPAGARRAPRRARRPDRARRRPRRRRRCRARAGRRRSGAWLSTPMTRAARADARAAPRPRTGGPLLPPAPRTHHGRRPGRTRRATCGAAPATSSTASARRSGMSAGILRERRRSRRRSPSPSTSSCAATGRTARTRVERERRERERGERRDPVARARSRGPAPSAPTRRTAPRSIPPEPVTGLCCLPRRRTVSSTEARRPPSGSPPRGLLHLAEARGVDVQGLDVDDDLGLVEISSTSASSRSAGCGRAPAGSSTRCVPRGSPGEASHGAVPYHGLRAAGSSASGCAPTSLLFLRGPSLCARGVDALTAPVDHARIRPCIDGHPPADGKPKPPRPSPPRQLALRFISGKYQGGEFPLGARQARSSSVARAISTWSSSRTWSRRKHARIACTEQPDLDRGSRLDQRHLRQRREDQARRA